MLNNREKEAYINNTASVLANSTGILSYDDTDIKTRYHYLKSPIKLYRYCRFDENGYSLDAIRNGYLYLTPTEKLDDQFEIAVNMAKYETLAETRKARKEIRERLLKKVAEKNPKSLDAVKRIRRNLDNGLFSEEALKRLKESIRESGDQFNMVSEFFSKPDFIQNNEDLFCYLATMDQKLGLCALTEEKANQVMWVMYGDNYHGMMIEYDFGHDNYRLKANLLPVIYKKKRENDPLDLYIDIMLRYYRTQDQKKAKEVLYQWILKTISTKNEEWSFQNEWRMVGNSGQKIAAPPVKAVYLGKFAREEDRVKILSLSKEQSFKVYEQTEDFETMKIKYNKLK